MSVLRKSKTAKVMRVKAGVAASIYVSGQDNRVVLATGALFPSNSPVVEAAPWAFEPADDDPEIQALVDALQGLDTVSFGPTYVSDPEANARLQAVRDEIAALAKPLPTPRGRVDVNELAAKLTARDQRRRALELTPPALQREILIGNLHAAKAVTEVEQLALDQAAQTHHAFEEKYTRAKSDFDRSQFVVNAAAQRVSRCHEQASKALHAIEELDTKAGFLDEPEGDPEAALDPANSALVEGWSVPPLAK